MKRLIHKWDPREGKYRPYVVLGKWNVSVHEEDMNRVVNCAGCGQRLAFGDAYTSLQIHTPGGLGYAVCRKCHVKEMQTETEKEEEGEKEKK